MYDRITLGVNGDCNLIQTRLCNHPECAFPISITKDESPHSITYIDFEPADDIFALNQYVSVVAEYIIERYETRMLRRILEEYYRDLSPIGKREIIKNIERFSDDPEVGYTARKEAVLLSVYDYLKEDTTMFLDGFVSFRLKDYEALLALLAEKLVDDYVTRKEYEEFISLLKYFVTVQQGRPELVHIFVQSEGGYTLTDAAGEDITARCFADFLDGEILLTEEAYDDLLISVLITLAPQKITVHHADAIKNHELFTTISKVFDEKVTFCTDCSLCKN